MFRYVCFSLMCLDNHASVVGVVKAFRNRSPRIRVRIRITPDFHVRGHLGFHILSPGNGLPFFFNAFRF